MPFIKVEPADEGTGTIPTTRFWAMKKSIFQHVYHNPHHFEKAFHEPGGGLLRAQVGLIVCPCITEHV